MEALQRAYEVLAPWLPDLYPNEEITPDYILRVMLNRPKTMIFIFLMGTIRVHLAQKWSFWSSRGVNGPKPSVMSFGNVDIFFKLMSDKADEVLDVYGDMFGFYAGRKPYLYLNDVSIMKEVNIKQFSKFTRREPESGANTVLGEFSKDFMTTVDGHQWKRIRQSTVPLMSAAKLIEVVPLINKAADVCCDQIQVGEDYEAKELSSRYTIRAIMSATFAVDSDDKAAMDEAAVHANNVIPDNLSVTKLMLYAMIPESIRFKFGISPVDSVTTKYFDSLVQQHLSLVQQGKGIKCFTSQMMSSIIDDSKMLDKGVTKGFTIREIKANALLVIMAGYETTASTLQFTLYRLCKDQDVQEKLYQLCKDMDAGNYESVREFKYLDAVIKESMRMYPAAPFNSRVCSETTEIKEGITIEAGTTVSWSNLKIHMNPEIYDQPEKFDPDRWEGNESNTLQDEAWFGFGQGPRACPGTRLAYYFMKIYIVHMLKKFKIIPTEGTPENAKSTIKNLKLCADQPLLIQFEKRK